MQIRVIALDPGETTGYFIKDYDTGSGNSCGEIVAGGTVESYHARIFELLDRYKPDVVVLESFKLYPGKAKSLAWNSFYPCEVIGVIRLWVQLQNAAGLEVKEVQQAPSVKKYAGGLQEDWQYFQHNMLEERVTEHVKDAYMHIKYWERYNRKSLQK